MKVILHHLTFKHDILIEYCITCFPFDIRVTILSYQVGLILLTVLGCGFMVRASWSLLTLIWLTSLSASTLPLLLLSSLLLITILENLISILSCWLGLEVVGMTVF